MPDSASRARRLHTHLFGPDSFDAPLVLAVHGLTGHGRRWERMAAEGLPGVRVIAPDLLGHGRSPWEPPWRVDDHADALADVLDRHAATADRPVVVIAHSFGCAVVLALAERRPADIAGLVLLDPAQALDPGRAGVIAEAAMANWGNVDADDAKAAKRMEGWGAVPADVLEEEVAEHLVPTADGRVAWRVSAPAAATAWSEMTRPFRLPPAAVPTHVVVADRVDPPFVGPEFLTACAVERPDTVTVHHVDTEHMIPFLAPELCAELVRSLL
ncbi:alpha/beta hydrolase [Gordonia neofelifaecis]|uniref:Alpha/beta hydrolase fold protein n=1 Tax=Gordonia neofelifaecis NRRL B-59395 TaxID=644548 RepID=F1YJL1_9ACTN|nr:alpha/beta fold hydrolase [Gordonia neofelifaecis]EGD55244.1 alpha/beta hydrolase fold protein [Gordonia neofelifaecis NRRL B-59395]